MSNPISRAMEKAFLFTSHHAFSREPHPALESYIFKLSRMEKDGGEGYGSEEHALLLPMDNRILEEARQMAKRHATPRLKYVIVIGIGGSNLGTKAVYDALRGAYDLLSRQTPKLLFLDTLSNATIAQVGEILSVVAHPDEILINLISKSGTNTEPLANFELLNQALEKHFPNIASRVVCTTDVGSPLCKKGGEHGFGLLPIPALVGGRFSVFSLVGIFPLVLAGVDVPAFCRGADDMFHVVVSSDQEKNYARISAEEIFGALGSGCSMLNIFHFNPELESLGKWERQLIAESLGKERDCDGKVVHAGITPIVSIGSTDLHSMAQLYFGGPRDKFTMLIRAGEDTGGRISEEGILSPLTKGMARKSGPEIMEAIFEGVKGAYEKNKLPFSVVRLGNVSPYTLGLYMEWRMATVLYLAKLLNVNPFDQPNVEDYKKLTREILNQ